MQGRGTGAGAPPKPRSATAVGALSNSYVMPKPARSMVHEVVPAGETQVRRGEHVYARHGQIGRALGFLVDSNDHRATHVLLQEGHLRGRKELVIPMSAVIGVQEGIRLNISKQQVENLIGR